MTLEKKTILGETESGILCIITGLWGAHAILWSVFLCYYWYAFVAACQIDICICDCVCAYIVCVVDAWFLCDASKHCSLRGCNICVNLQTCLLPVFESQPQFRVLGLQVSDIIIASRSLSVHVFVPVLPSLHHCRCLVNTQHTYFNALASCSCIFTY